MEFVTVVHCLNQAEADVRAAELRAAGFNVLVHSESSALTRGLPLTVGGIRLQVPQDQEDEARRFLAADDATE